MIPVCHLEAFSDRSAAIWVLTWAANWAGPGSLWLVTGMTAGSTFSSSVHAASSWICFMRTIWTDSMLWSGGVNSVITLKDLNLPGLCAWCWRFERAWSQSSRREEDTNFFLSRATSPTLCMEFILARGTRSAKEWCTFIYSSMYLFHI